LEFGTGGYQAHAASEVLHNGYGDCKDKVGLLATLADAVGLQVYPALVHLERGIVEPGVPMPAQFNHVIAAASLDGQLLWMDPTLELAPMGLLVSDLRGKRALLVEPGNAHLEQVPEESPVPESGKVILKGRLDAAGKITLDSQLQLRGSTEVLYRKLFHLGNADAIKTAIAALAETQVAGTTSENPTSSDPTEVSHPFRVHYQLTHSGWFGALETNKEIALPHLLVPMEAWSSELSRIQKKPQPTTAVKPGSPTKELSLGDPGEVEESLDLELDPSFKAELPLPVQADRPFAFYSSTYALDANHVKADRILRVKARKLPADRWEEVASLQKIIDGDLAQKLVLRRVGLFDIRSQLQNLSADELNDIGFRALNERQDFALARDVLVQATEKDPRHKWAWNNLGRAYLGLRMIDEAQAAFKKQIEINPADQYAHNNLGGIYAGRHQYEEAISEFKKQLEVNPLDPWTYPRLAQALANLERWNDAADAWRKAITIDREKPHYYVSLAHALTKAGQTDAAREQLDRALEKDPRPEMLNNVAWELADSGVDLDRAERHAKSAIEGTVRSLENLSLNSMTPEKMIRFAALGSYVDTLGWVYFKKEHLADSQPYLEAAYTLHPDPIIAEHLARLHARLKHRDATLHFYSCSFIQGPRTEETPKDLQDYLTQQLGSEQELKSQVSRELPSCMTIRQIDAGPGHSLRWPKDAALTASSIVHLALQVDERGNVDAAEPVSGDEPFRTTAQADAKQLRLPRIHWPGETLRTVRTATFAYSGGKVSAFWSFGEPTGQNETLVRIGGTMHVLSTTAQVQGTQRQDSEPNGSDPYQAHLRTAAQARLRRDLTSAIAEYRQAISLDATAVTAHQALAATLDEAGSRQEAIVEYREVVRLDPHDAGAHFALGTDFEYLDKKGLAGFVYDPKAKRLVPPKGWKPSPELKNAFDEYKKAHELAPGNTSFEQAYDRLAELLGKN
jgi:tetratricopeptide (TPR) repeat protein